MKKVAVVYHYFAHYRLPIMETLMSSNKNKYYFLGGEGTDTKIETIKIKKGSLLYDRFVLLENIWLKKKILWQNGLIKQVLMNEYDAYIFLGSIFHLSTWVAASIARIKGKKVYFWMHGFYKDSTSISDFVKIYIFYKLANEFFLYGNRAMGKLRDLGIKKSEEMHIIYNSLDYEKSLSFRRSLSNEDLESFRKKYFQNSELPTVSFIGRVNKIKRIDMLINAQNILYLKYNRSLFNILIIGDGEEVDRLRVMVESMPYLSDNIKFLGAVYDERLNAELLLHSDLCVTPGEVGLTAIHSLSYGTPVLSHNNFNIQMPEVESIKSGVTGDFYEYGSIESLAGKIEAWFKLNPQKSSTVMSQCFAVIDEYYNPKYQLSIFDSVLN